MFTKKILPLAVAAGLTAGAATTASAEDAISANVTLASDYVWRGVSQTNEDAAIQGGFDYGHDSGFYIGTWASNVNFGGGLDGGSTEIDVYGGWAGDVSDNVGFDVGFIYYGYQSDTDLDFLELQAAINFFDATLGFNYTDEFGEDGPENLYIHAEYSRSFNDFVALDLHLGYTKTDEDDFWGGEDDTYYDWLVGLTFSTPAGVDLGIAYTDTDIEGTLKELGEARAVFSISKAF